MTATVTETEAESKEAATATETTGNANNNQLPATIPVPYANCDLQMPIVGFGMYQVMPADTERITMDAIQCGYRHFDGASLYNNEVEFGKAVRKNKIPRKELFITGKVWNDCQGYEATLKSCEQSLQDLQMDYFDLFMVHWPVEKIHCETYSAVLKLYNDGKCKSIGVSNYLVPDMNELLEYNLNNKNFVFPSVNQLHINPLFFQPQLLSNLRQLSATAQPNNHDANQNENVNDTEIEVEVEVEVEVETEESAHNQNGIGFGFEAENANMIIQAYKPLERANADLLQHPSIVKLASKYGLSCAQICLKWGLQQNIVELVKSKHKPRMKENMDVFTVFKDMDSKQISNDDMLTINALTTPETMQKWTKRHVMRKKCITI